MEIDFKGKTALVTGAGKGIGRATVIMLAKFGANIVALSRTKSDLDSLKSEVPTKFTPVVADLLQLDEAIKAIEATGEHIDLLVNNAGLVVLKDTMDLTGEDIDRSMTVNVKATILLSQLVARDLIKRGASGAIVNVSTVLTDMSPAHAMPYVLTKVPVDTATKAMAVELAKHKIRVNAVLPGLVDTAYYKKAPKEGTDPFLFKTPRGVPAASEEIANTIAYLLSDNASNITGSRVVTDGGLSVN